MSEIIRHLKLWFLETLKTFASLRCTYITSCPIGMQSLQNQWNHTSIYFYSAYSYPGSQPLWQYLRFSPMLH